MTSDVLRRPATRVWLGLMAATISSWAIAEQSESPRLAASFVVLIAAFKARLVIVHFMELDWRPMPWRILLEGWTFVSAAMILGGFWLASP